MTHMREFEPVLPDARPYVARAAALYERAVREKRGGVVFIAAEPGGGKTEHLGALAKALHRSKPRPNIVAGYFSAGEYQRYKLDWQDGVSLKKTLAAAGSLASLLALCPLPSVGFAFNLIAQFVETSAAAREFAEQFRDDPGRRPEGARWLRDLLRRAAAERPLVCLLDDWDEARRFEWDNMLFGLAREVARDLPALLFITVRSPVDLDAPAHDEAGAVIKSLLGKGLAEWWPLEKLSRAEVAAAVGEAAPSVVSALHGVTDGNARWVKELWREWRLEGVVETDAADRWVWKRPRGATLGLYGHIVEDRLTRLLRAETAVEVEDAREVLACAALEGMSFTAEAVALAAGWHTDELIDFFDEVLVRTEENPEGLLLEDGSARVPDEGGGERTLWRYRFVSDLHRMALERDGFARVERPQSGTERRAKCLAMIEALKQTYAAGESLAAAPLARLLREVGKTESAQRYQRIADFGTNREGMREQALRLIAVEKDDWEPWQCGRAAKLLIKAADAMLHTFPYDETLAVLEEARRLAPRAGNHPDQEYATFLSSFILMGQNEYQSSRERANEALELARLSGSGMGVARALGVLARVAHAEGRYGRAREHALEALEIQQRLGLFDGEAVTRGYLGWVDLAEGDYAGARRHIQRALELGRESSRRTSEAVALNTLARIDFVEGDRAGAREHAAQALEIYREFGEREGESYALGMLATIAHAERDYAAARAHAERALTIQRELEDRAGEAMAWTVLAEICYAEGDFAGAREHAAQSLETSWERGTLSSRATTLRVLGEVADKLGLADEACDLTALSFVILSEIGDDDLKRVTRSLASLAERHSRAEAGREESLRRAREAYERDGGRESVARALARMREAGG